MKMRFPLFLNFSLLNLFLTILVLTNNSFAAGTPVYSVPTPNESTLEYPYDPNSKMLVVYPLLYGPFGGAYYPSATFKKADLDKIKDLDEKATATQIKKIEFCGAAGAASSSFSTWAGIYKNNVLLHQVTGGANGGTLSATTLIENIV
jgi:hypothetical protein